MNNDRGSIFSLKAASLETVIWTKEEGESIKLLGSAPASLDHRLMCPEHSISWSYFAFSVSLQPFSGRSLYRPEKHTMHHGSKKASGLLHMWFPLPELFFPNKPLCTWPNWALRFIKKSLVSENLPDLPKLGIVYLQYSKCTLNWKDLFVGLY